MIYLFFAAATAFTIVAVAGNFVIPALTYLKFGQTVRQDGPKRHLKKMGTPTMGGIMIIPAVIIATIIFSGITNNSLLAVIAATGFGLIGFMDDYIKVVKKRSLGLRASQKILMQLILSVIITLYAYYIFPGDSRVLFPFLNKPVDLGLFYIPFNLFIVLGVVNSVNLTDGLDGLVSGIMLIISFFYTLIGLYFGSHEVSFYSASISGAALGFLLYNHYPAKVFMGDTGSLGFGGALAFLAISTKTQFYLLFFGFILVMETLSVIIQVLYFRTTGKRIFKMAPLHHHFELCGMSEIKVVLFFWAIALLSCSIGYYIFNLSF
ncbi:phospho-N-acetylmuramoyl-pentapeptide-transferase [Thermovenabulum gondwanense]|uniref:Phospho-N-acetylmuramoyl-pentapeptide-transferase n=1 Tax=Thermovenabulum gondwanense TaxID=520767 RepID=A0A162MM04_9FIRM|nr:phospho-N-acetylmuramoyl-pentapeptide-transferase [Thermovenabulum gondwanense]KYO66678.1 Phospho-N-acetylmuramoyl-pentapeptide-transferase [Thermovenabulum gondwanense]